MSDPSRKRRSLPHRTAAVAATALGAAMLAAPGTATAQTGVDCAALGERPAASGMEAALTAAAQCGVEVRITSRIGPYVTLYATPEGQLHQVQTVDPVQEYSAAYASVDPTLVVWDGALVQERTRWGATLAYDDPAGPLFGANYGWLDWEGERPVPTYSGTTAVYDELAPGLDLTVDVGVSTASLRFAAADADAWTALATGLEPDTYYGLEITAEGGLELGYDLYDGVMEATTRFILRDANGDTLPVQPVLDADGAFSLDADADALASAAYPLALSTQWVSRDPEIGEWLSTTSAEPDTSVYRGEAGFETPYFEAAGQDGDALVGTYCDTLTDATCATEYQAETYWLFRGQAFGGLRPVSGYTFAYPITSATFQVDAAEGTDCVAPDLKRFSEGSPGFSTTTAWSSPGPRSPDPVGTGTCQDGTAVYDATSAMRPMNHLVSEFSDTVLGMDDSAATARFDGGSARLDVYYAVVGYKYADASTAICGTQWDAPTHVADSTPSYGGFLFDIWRPDLVGGDFTWKAAVTRDSGSTVVTTDPVPVVDGQQEVLSLGTGLANQRHGINYTIASTTNSFRLQDSCHIVVDTVAPKLVDVSEFYGPYHVGSAMSVQVTVSDSGYPGALDKRTLTVECLGTACGTTTKVTMTDRTVASFWLELTSTAQDVVFQVSDKAGNKVASEVFTIRATYPSNDYGYTSGQDVLVVDRETGRLHLYSSFGDGTFGGPLDLGRGWGVMDVVMAGDLTGDGNADVLARDTKTGTLYTYPGNGDDGFGARIKVGTGWNAVSLFTSSDDFDRDGKNDLLAVSRSDGRLYLYPGRGDGTFGSRTALDDGWNVFDGLTTVGDVDADGRQDFLVHDSATGKYYVYLGSSAAAFGERIELDPSLGDAADGRRYREATGVGDVDSDGIGDVIAIDTRTNEAVLLSFAPDGSTLKAEELAFPSGLYSRFPVVESDRTYDVRGDGASDVIARRASDGELLSYTGNGTGGFRGSERLGDHLAGMNLIETAGDFNGDGFADLLARTSGGVLYLYPGLGQGGVSDARIRIGGGWGAMSTIVSGHDYDNDGKVDIIAREASTGDLYLYPGTGSGSAGSRIRIGTGWNGMALITAAGDLDHDGVADVIARKNSDNCLYFYAGKPTGGVKNGVKIGCGWNVMNTVAAVGDFTGDGHADWVARHTNGNLYLYKGNGAGSYSGSVVIGSGWGSMSIIA